MKHQIFVIHGGHASNSYEEYLKYLKEKEVTLGRLRSKDWKASLGEKLGEEFEVFAPKMPNQQNAKYLEWKIYFEKLIPLMESDVVLIGHSLGGIFLAKYLSEETFPKKIRATFLVAAPFDAPDGRSLADFVLSSSLNKFEQQGGDIFLYQSRDDDVVPFSNVEEYQRALPHAHVSVFDDMGHFNSEHFPELEKDIRSLKF